MKNHELKTEGRIIITNDPRLEWIAKGLHARLKYFGDIKGVGGIAQVTIYVKDDDVRIEVDRDCEYNGYHNYSQGVFSKRACELSLMSMLLSDLMWVSIPRKPRPGVLVIDNTIELREFYPGARQVDDYEAAGLRREYEQVWDEIETLDNKEQIAIDEFLD